MPERPALRFPQIKKRPTKPGHQNRSRQRAMKAIFLSAIIVTCAICAEARYALSNDDSAQLQTFFGSDLRTPKTCRGGDKTYVLTSTDSEWYFQAGSPAGATPEWSYSETYYPSSGVACVDSGSYSPSSRPAIFALRSPSLMDVSGDFFVQTRPVPGCSRPASLSYGDFAQIDWATPGSDWYPNLNGVVMLYSCDAATKVLFYSLYDAVSGNGSIPIIYEYNSTADRLVGIDAGAFAGSGQCATAFAHGKRVVLMTASAALEGIQFAYTANWELPLVYQAANNVTSVALLSSDQVAYSDLSESGDGSIYVVNMTTGNATLVYTRAGGERCLVLAGNLEQPELDAAGRDLLVQSGSALIHFYYQPLSGQWAAITLPLDFGYEASVALSRGHFLSYARMNLVSLIRMKSEATLNYYYGYELSCSDYSGDSAACFSRHCTYCAEEGLCTEGTCPDCQAIDDETACLANLCHWCGEVAQCTSPSSPCELCRHLDTCRSPCVACNSSGLCFSQNDVCTYCPEYTAEPNLCLSSPSCRLCNATGECLSNGEPCFDCHQHQDLYSCGFDPSCAWCSYRQTCEGIHSKLSSPLTSSLCRCGDARLESDCSASPGCFWKEEAQRCITMKCAKGKPGPMDFVSTIADPVEGATLASDMDYSGNFYALVQIETGPYVMKVNTTPEYVCRGYFAGSKTIAKTMVYDPYADLIYVVGGGINLPLSVDNAPADVGFMAALKTQDCFIAALSARDCSTYWAVPWGSKAEGETFTDMVIDGDFIAISGIVGVDFPLDGTCIPDQTSGLAGITLIYDRAWNLVSCQFCGARLNKLSSMDGRLVTLGMGQFEDRVEILRYFGDSKTWLCDYIITGDPVLNSSAITVFKDTTGDYLVAVLPTLNSTTNGTLTRLFVTQFYTRQESIVLQTDLVSDDSQFRLLVTDSRSIYSFRLTFDVVGYVYNQAVSHPIMGTVKLGYDLLNQTLTVMNLRQWEYLVFAPENRGQSRFVAMRNFFNMIIVAGYTTEATFYETTQQPHSPDEKANPMGVVFLREDADTPCLPSFPVAPSWMAVAPLKLVNANVSLIDVAWPTFKLEWDSAFFGFANGWYRLRVGSSVDLVIPYDDVYDTKVSQVIDAPFTFERANTTWEIEPHTPYSFTDRSSWIVYRVVPVEWPRDMVRYASLENNGVSVSFVLNNATAAEEVYYEDGKLVLVTAYAEAYVNWSTTSKIFNLTGQRWLVFSLSAYHDAGRGGFSWLPGYPRVRLETYDGYLEFAANSAACQRKQAGQWAQFGIPLSPEAAREDSEASGCAWAVTMVKRGAGSGASEDDQPDLRGVNALCIHFSANTAIVQLNLTNVSLADSYAPVYAPSESSAGPAKNSSALGLLALTVLPVAILLAILILLVYRKGKAKSGGPTTSPLYSAELKIRSDFQRGEADFISDASLFPLWVPTKPLYFGYSESLAPIDTLLVQSIYISNGPWKSSGDGIGDTNRNSTGGKGSTEGRHSGNRTAKDGSGTNSATTTATATATAKTSSGSGSGSGRASRKTASSATDGLDVAPRCGDANAKYSWKIYPPKQAKFTLEFAPNSGSLSPGKQTEVTVSLYVRCTTNLDLDVPIAICEGAEYDEERKQSYTHLKIKISTVASTKLDPEEIEIPEGTKPVGSGTYGNVYAGHIRGQEVAIKIMKNQQPADEDMKAFVSEAAVMEKLKHPCVLQFVGACYIPGRLALITELCPLGTLKGFCEKEASAKRHLDYSLKVKCLFDCAKGMNFIHRNNIIHRDLKPANLLMISADPKAPVCCKVADMGTTREVNQLNQTQQYTKEIGTPIYMAPEIMNGLPYSPLADVYSFAILAYELMTEIVPYSQSCTIDGKTYDFQGSYKVTDFAVTGKRLPIPAAVPRDAADLITDCWNPDHKARPSFEEIAKRLGRVLAETIGSVTVTLHPIPRRHHHHHHQEKEEKRNPDSADETHEEEV